MKRILLTSAALVALTGVALAQQAPVLQGNYSANVIETYNRDAANNGGRLIVEGMGAEMRASARAVFSGETVDLQTGGLTGDLADQNDNRGR
jgi:hypothetical protein